MTDQAPAEQPAATQADLAQRVLDETGQNVNLCYQCVKCTSGCPLAEFFDWQPNQVMRAVQLGDTDFDAGSAARLSEEIADNGPWLVPDVAGGGRDIVVNHLGDDPEAGWYAFDARPSGETRDCFFTWDDGADVFVLTTIQDDVVCSDATATATGEGEGVTVYPVTIDDGRVRVDINFESNEESDA